MALAVAMVACSGAAGTPGPAGPPGKDAPTPDPTTPTTPTTPTEPPGPTGAAPVVAKAIPPVYLALEGTGEMLSKAIMLDKHITDADSQIKYSAMSSDDKVATATLPVNGRTVTIKAVRVGTATITVTARDGDNDPVTAPISVTVVRNNARPTTNDLSQLDRTELEKVLYVSDGVRTDTVTVVAFPGGTSSEPVEDSIASFKIAYGAKKTLTSKYVTVSVDKSTIEDQYVIKVTPKKASLGMGSEKIMIYPKDMFGAESSEVWKFSAMFNTPPGLLDDSFGTIRLARPVPGEAATVEGIIVLPTANGNAATISISDYFKDLQRGVMGDTVCAVTASPETLAVVQELNAPADSDDVVVGELRAVNGPLGAIRIDSRVSALGADKLVSEYTPANEVSDPDDDTRATGEGAFDITIRCTDKDDTAEVTGRVIVQQLS